MCITSRQRRKQRRRCGDRYSSHPSLLIPTQSHFAHLIQELYLGHQLKTLSQYWTTQPRGWDYCGKVVDIDDMYEG